MNNKKTNYILSKITDNVETNEHSSIQITAIEGKILQLLIKMNDIKKVVEIGTLYGYSTMWIAKQLNNEIVYTIEKNPENAKIAAKNFQKFDNIKLIIGDAEEKLVQLENNKPFDMIFIDANKSKYLHYLGWVEKNVKKDGIIVADNTLSFGDIKIYEEQHQGKKSWQIMNLFNERLADSTKYDSIIIPTEKGLTIAIKKF